MFQPDLEVSVQIESEYAPAGGTVRGTLTVVPRKIVAFTKVIAVVRGLESSFAGSEGNIPQFEEELFYKEDCIVFEPKDSNDNFFAPNKTMSWPFEIRLNPGLPASIVYEEATVCFEVIGFVITAVPAGKKPTFWISPPKDLFLWGTSRAKWNKAIEQHPLPPPKSAHKGKVAVTARLEEAAIWQMGDQALVAVEIENHGSSPITQIAVSLQQRCTAQMRKFKNKARVFFLVAQFNVNIPPGGRFSETLGVPIPTWRECSRIWQSARGNKFANMHSIFVTVKEAKVDIPVTIYDALVEKQQEQTQNKLIASTSGDRFKQPELQMLARSVSRAQLGTDRAKQRLKDEKEGRETWREAEPVPQSL